MSAAKAKQGEAAHRVNPQDGRQLHAILSLVDQGYIERALDSYRQSGLPKKLTSGSEFMAFCRAYGLPDEARTRLATVARLHGAKVPAETHLARGLLYSHIKLYDEALGEFEKALEQVPGNAECLVMLAKTCGLLQLAERAEAYLQDLERQAPGNQKIQIEIGKVFDDYLSRFDKSIHHFNRAVEMDSRDFAGHYHLANTLKKSNQLEDAIQSYDAAIGIDPNHVEALNNRGACLQTLNRDEAAIGDFDRAISLDPRHLFAWMNKGTSLSKLERYRESLNATIEAFAIDPSMPEIAHNHGINLMKLDRHEEALDYFDSEIVIAPTRLEAYLSRGNALHALHRYEEAVGAFKDALEIDPTYTDAHINAADALQELGRHDDAIDILDEALEVRPGFSDVLWNKSNSLLAFGPAKEAWEAYEHRLHISTWAPIPDLGLPLLSHTGARRGKLLIQWEQRFGDVVQMLRFLPQMEERYECYWQLAEPLLDLARASFPSINICGREETPEGLDFRTPYTSLPLNCEIFSFDAIPGSSAYLRSSDAAAKRWQDAIDDPAAKIGLTWRGNTNPPGRSVPIESLESLLESFAGHFVSLQMDVTEEEAEILKRHAVPDLGDRLRSFDDSAALLQQLPLVLSIDTAVAHLAGAVGTPVWIMLKHGCDWRWYLDRDDSPWYPTAKLYRQKSAGDWQPVTGDISRDLKKILEERKAD